MNSDLLDLPSGSQPINDTRSRRFTTLLRIKLTRLFRKKQSAVLHLDSATCVKYGGDIDLAEAHVLQFISANTSVPVPRVYCAFERKGRTYIVMERVKGSKLSDKWHQLPEKVQDQLLIELRDMVDEMRSISPPSDSITSIAGGSLWNSRLPTREHRFGPFRDTSVFHKFLWETTRRTLHRSSEKESLDEFLVQADPAWDRPVFTHGDLNSMNILVEDDHIAAILDWETAGWYPSYWEYTCAIQVHPWNLFWKEHISSFLDPLPQALQFEQQMLSTGRLNERPLG